VFYLCQLLSLLAVVVALLYTVVSSIALDIQYNRDRTTRLSSKEEWKQFYKLKKQCQKASKKQIKLN